MKIRKERRQVSLSETTKEVQAIKNAILRKMNIAPEEDRRPRNVRRNEARAMRKRNKDVIKVENKAILKGNEVARAFNTMFPDALDEAHQSITREDIDASMLDLYNGGK